MKELAITEMQGKISEIAEELDWTCTISNSDDGLDVEFSKYSPEGEDFYISLRVDSLKDIPSELEEYWEGFDVEEHAITYYGCAGAPGLRALLDDAEYMEKDIQKLQLALEVIF